MCAVSPNATVRSCRSHACSTGSRARRRASAIRSDATMKALIFAAGRGERMRPLSDQTAKPLLSAGGKRLIEWQIEALARAGIHELVINLAHLADTFEPVLGDGLHYGVRIQYSREGTAAEEALETLGGIVN